MASTKQIACHPQPCADQYRYIRFFSARQRVIQPGPLPGFAAPARTVRVVYTLVARDHTFREAPSHETDRHSTFLVTAARGMPG